MGNKELKEERMKILDLLAKGVITSEQAETLLNALNGPEKEPEVILPEKKKNQFRVLKVLVDSADGDEVRIELPIEFAKLLKNSKMTHINENDLDIDVDMLIQMINSGAIGELVNVKSADGDIVKILVE